MSKLSVLKLNGKMRCILLILLGLLISVDVNATVNYCGSKICSHTYAHTFCQFPAGPSPACNGYMDARLTSKEKTRITARLNERRSDVAMGFRNLPPAGNMLKLRWVEELAREAQRWADQCRPVSSPEEHDICRDLYSITVGQCVASVVGEAPGLRPETMVDMWYMQSKHFISNVTSYVASNESSKYYDDFAQMFWSRTYMVGCGRSRFMTVGRGRPRSIERLVCNFAPRGPEVYRSLWNPTDPATACPPRATPDPVLPALCVYHNYTEDMIDENNVMSLEDNLLLDTLHAIERNKTLDYIGSIDEIYLTKFAIMTMANFDSQTSLYHSVEKRDHINNNYSSDVSIKTNNNLPRMKMARKKAYIVGRPKTYKVEDLNDSNNDEVIENKREVLIERKKDFYDYEQYNEIGDATMITPSSIKIYGNVEDTSRKETAVLNADDTNAAMRLERDSLELKTDGDNITVQVHQSKTPVVLNETAIEDNAIDEYLRDPDTARQLQEALDIVERKLASTSTPAKVRRELRTLEEVTEDYTQQPTLDADFERNKTIDRGPMLSMVMKYMPYLKTYEKSIIGEPSPTSDSTVIKPLLTCYFIIHLFIICF